MRGRRGGRRRNKSGRYRRTPAIESHPACACEVVLVDAGALDELLGHDVAGREEKLWGVEQESAGVVVEARRLCVSAAVGGAWPLVKIGMGGGSKVARTAVVTLCVSTGRWASFIWYLTRRCQRLRLSE